MTIKTDNLQLGLSNTPGNNFVMDANTPGVLKTGVGNFDSFTEVQRVDSGGNMQRVIPGGSVLYPDFACRAWVNWAGSGSNGSQTIRGSGNISSVVRTSAGNYTINFATPMPDTNFCVQGTSGYGGGDIGVTCESNAYTASSLSVVIATDGGGTADVTFNNVAIFR